MMDPPLRGGRGTLPSPPGPPVLLPSPRQIDYIVEGGEGYGDDKINVRYHQRDQYDYGRQ